MKKTIRKISGNYDTIVIRELGQNVVRTDCGKDFSNICALGKSAVKASAEKTPRVHT